MRQVATKELMTFLLEEFSSSSGDANKLHNATEFFYFRSIIKIKDYKCPEQLTSALHNLETENSQTEGPSLPALLSEIWNIKSRRR